MASLSRLSPFVAVLLVCLCIAFAHAADVSYPNAYVPPTSRRYTMLIEELTAGLDEDGTRPTLVSIMEETTLTLPTAVNAAAAWEGDAEAGEVQSAAVAQLTFDEDFDPIWYYVLRRRGFEHLDWSGCGGKWRPEWAIPKRSATGPTANAEESTLLFDQLRDYLTHHAVCTYSSVSFCGASRERDAESQFQWAAQFISTLTSSPLSWTDASPRHSRPNGVLLERPLDNTSCSHATSGDDHCDAYWCSYHLVYHDTLCTQHISPLLNGGRSGRGVQEGLPRGIFRAAIPSFVHFFGTPFHHFTVKATQERKRPGNASTDAVELRVQVRMSLVARERSELLALADVWTRELPAYAAEGRLQIHIGPGGLSKRLRAALPVSAVASAGAGITAATPAVAAAGLGGGSGVGWSPEVPYEVHSHGKDHGYLTVELQPALAILDAQSGVAWSDDAATAAAAPSHHFRLRAGDVVRTLLLFPLHLTRPSLYNMESLVGSTRVVHAHTDVSSNTLAVLLETPVTAVHVAAYEAAYAQARARHQHDGGEAAGQSDRHRQRPEGVLLGRFSLFFGWTALHEMPPDDNSNRIVPQPIVAIVRPAANASAETDDFCAAQRHGGSAAGIPPLDHVSSLAAVFELMKRSSGVRGGGKSPAAGGECVYWVRSTVASGTTIPGPDGAMVFNVLSLGLVFSAVGAGIMTRFTRRLTIHPEALAVLEAEEAK